MRDHSRWTAALLAFALIAGCKSGNTDEDTGEDTTLDTGVADLVEDPDVPDTSIDPDADPDVDVDLPPDGCIVEDSEPDPVDAEDPDTGTDAPDDTGTDVDADAPLDGDGWDLDVEVEVEVDAGVDVEWDGTPFVSCGDLLPDARDGRVYATVQIGTQCWMAQNLDVGTRIDGTVDPTNDGVIEKWCYDDDPANCTVYGGLYAWNELMDWGPSDADNPSTTQGICPAGWHVPSDEEVKVLEIFLGMTPAEADLTNIWRGSGVGAAMRVGGTSGYDALMSGRNAGGVFSLLDSTEYFYTSTDHASNAWRRCLSATADDVGRWNTFPKTWGLSLRCVLD